MLHSRKEARKIFNKLLYHPYYKHECEYCKNDIVVDLDECTVSNGVVKYKCPICGHINTVDFNELVKNRCSYDGEQHTIFVLTSAEVESANKFKEEHKHNEDNNDSIPAIGEQFVYEITPSNMGKTVIIKCNECGAKKNITETNNW